MNLSSHMGTHHQAATQPEMQRCIEYCFECAQKCTQLSSHCLALGGPHASAEHISLLASCATICASTAKLMVFNSDYHHDMCQLCANVCNSCAEDCERLGPDDFLMQECAEACRRCAGSCLEMMAH